MGTVYQAKKNYQKAIEAYKNALRNNPTPCQCTLQFNTVYAPSEETTTAAKAEQTTAEEQ